CNDTRPRWGAPEQPTVGQRHKDSCRSALQHSLSGFLSLSCLLSSIHIRKVLREGLTHHRQTLDIKLKRMKCAAMEGLVEESKEVIDEIEKGPVRDAALIGGAQKAEHYEIASYGTLCEIAKQLGHTAAVDLLKQTLAEEKATDEKLTLLAESGANAKAAGTARNGKAAKSA